MLVSKYESRKGENDFRLVSGYSFLFKTRHWRKDSIGFSAHNRISRHP